MTIILIARTNYNNYIIINGETIRILRERDINDFSFIFIFFRRKRIVYFLFSFSVFNIYFVCVNHLRNTLKLHHRGLPSRFHFFLSLSPSSHFSIYNIYLPHWYFDLCLYTYNISLMTIVNDTGIKGSSIFTRFKLRRVHTTHWMPSIIIFVFSLID